MLSYKNALKYIPMYVSECVIWSSKSLQEFYLGKMHSKYKHEYMYVYI